MGFTTPCFIRKNTDNIRNRLKEVGYNLLWHIEQKQRYNELRPKLNGKKY